MSIHIQTEAQAEANETGQKMAIIRIGGKLGAFEIVPANTVKRIKSRAEIKVIQTVTPKRRVSVK